MAYDSTRDVVVLFGRWDGQPSGESREELNGSKTVFPPCQIGVTTTILNLIHLHAW